MTNNKPANNNPEKHYVPNEAVSRRRRKNLLVAFFSLLSLLIVILLAVFIPYLASTAAEGHTVLIPRDAKGKQVRDTLYRYFEHGYADKVMAVAQIKDESDVRSGAFNIQQGMSAWAAGRLLHSGAQTPVKLTINGFRSYDLLRDRVTGKLSLSPDDFDKVFTDSTRLAKHGLDPDSKLALFIDDTYEVYWNVTPEKLFDKLADNYAKVWNKERLKKAEALGLTPEEVMIICSIVDEETNAKDEKGDIGRLYINRLKKGMKLQADPTVRYALNDFTIKRVTQQHLKVDSPYNTYQTEGLPPGPIRTTSVATIDAVLNSKPSDYLYMCAKEDFSGTHNFAVDYATHQENARRYQNALNERGIK